MAAAFPEGAELELEALEEEELVAIEELEEPSTGKDCSLSVASVINDLSH
jgi:hypothetical protein